MSEKEKRERLKASGNVTRLEFYIGIAFVMVFVLFVADMAYKAVERQIWKSVVRLENRAEQTEQTMNSLAGETMDYVYNVVDEAERRRESVLSRHSMRVIGVNHKAGTIRLELTACPKEYSAGMEGTFYVGRDEIEEYIAPGIFDEEGVLCAEIELPLCKWVNANVSLRKDGSEKRQFLGELEITESMVTPKFEGRWKEFSHDTENGKDTLTGVMEVEMDLRGDWRGGSITLSDCMLEVQKDGETIQTVPMEGAAIDPEAMPPQNPKFHGRIQEPVLLEEGCEIAFFFKAMDGNGAKYTYLVQKGTLDAGTGRYIIQKDGKDGGLSEGRLTIG